MMATIRTNEREKVRLDKVMGSLLEGRVMLDPKRERG